MPGRSKVLIGGSRGCGSATHTWPEEGLPTMPVSPGLGLSVPAGARFYRITSVAFRTRSVAHHTKVVNVEGAVRSRHGARYNYPGVRSVYLADTLLTCFAERMFYFHREVLTGLDGLHLLPVSVVPRSSRLSSSGTSCSGQPWRTCSICPWPTPRPQASSHAC